MKRTHSRMLAKAIPDSSRRAISPFGLFVLLVFTLITPTLLFYTTGGASQAPGVGFVAAATALLAAFKIVPLRPGNRLANGLLIIVLILVAILAHGLVAWQIQANDLSRLLQSLGVFAICLIGAYIFASVIFEAPPESIKKAVSGALALLLAFALLGALQIAPYPSAIDASNPIFPYTEPSHLALALAPLSIAAAVFTRGWRRFSILVALLLVAFFLRSMTTLVVSVLLAAVAIPARYLIPTFLLALLALPYLETDYFAERLYFSVHNYNLSNLVYIQGWELLWDALYRTKGWGLGFQQLGIGQYDSPTADAIYRILGYDINIRDGGFTLSKFVSEFGVFAIILMTLYVTVLTKTFVALRSAAIRDSNDKGVLLARSFLLGAAIEFFVRGIGYFSPTLFLMISSIIYLSRKRKLF